MKKIEKKELKIEITFIVCFLMRPYAILFIQQCFSVEFFPDIDGITRENKKKMRRYI